MFSLWWAHTCSSCSLHSGLHWTPVHIIARGWAEYLKTTGEHSRAFLNLFSLVFYLFFREVFFYINISYLRLFGWGWTFTPIIANYVELSYYCPLHFCDFFELTLLIQLLISRISGTMLNCSIITYDLLAIEDFIIVNVQAIDLRAKRRHLCSIVIVIKKLKNCKTVIINNFLWFRTTSYFTSSTKNAVTKSINKQKKMQITKYLCL